MERAYDSFDRCFSRGRRNSPGAVIEMREPVKKIRIEINNFENRKMSKGRDGARDVRLLSFSPILHSVKRPIVAINIINIYNTNRNRNRTSEKEKT